MANKYIYTIEVDYYITVYSIHCMTHSFAILDYTYTERKYLPLHTVYINPLPFSTVRCTIKCTILLQTMLHSYYYTTKQTY